LVELLLKKRFFYPFCNFTLNVFDYKNEGHFNVSDVVDVAKYLTYNLTIEDSAVNFTRALTKNVFRYVSRTDPFIDVNGT